MVHLSPILQALYEGLIPRFLDALRNLFHCPFQRNHLPMIAVRRPIEYLRQATRVDGVLKCRGTFRTERAVVDGTLRIALNVNDLTIHDIDVQAASYSAVRTNA